MGSWVFSGGSSEVKEEVEEEDPQEVGVPRVHIW